MKSMALSKQRLRLLLFVIFFFGRLTTCQSSKKNQEITRGLLSSSLAETAERQRSSLDRPNFLTLISDFLTGTSSIVDESKTMTVFKKSLDMVITMKKSKTTYDAAMVDRAAEVIAQRPELYSLFDEDSTSSGLAEEAALAATFSLLAYQVDGLSVKEANHLVELLKSRYPVTVAPLLGDWRVHSVDKHVVVLKSQSKRAFVLAVRGSASLEDWTDQNTAIAIGRAPELVDRVTTRYSQLIHELPTMKLSFVCGHSLGGTVSEVFGGQVSFAASPVHVHSFNPGAGLLPIVSERATKRQTGVIIRHIVMPDEGGLDYLSMGALLGHAGPCTEPSRIYLHPRKDDSNHHRLRHFLPARLSFLNDDDMWTYFLAMVKKAIAS